MKYLVKGKITLSTENWEERNTTITLEVNEDGKQIEVKHLKTIEEFAKENGFEVVTKKPETLIQKEIKVELENELLQIKKWFLDNDYKVNKVIIGEWQDTDPRWIEYKKERSIKRARQDEINKLEL
jgi:hypothetical protein